MKQGIKLLSLCLACCVLFSSVVLAKSETDSLMGNAIRASLKEIEEEEIVLGENKVVAIIYKASFGELTRLHIVPNGGFLVDYHFGSPEDPAPKAVKRIMDSRGISYPNKLPLVIKNVDRHIAVLIELEVDGESKRTDFLKQYGDEIEGYGKYVFDFVMLLQRVVSAVDGTEYAPIDEGKTTEIKLALGKAKAARWLTGYSDGSMGANRNLARGGGDHLLPNDGRSDESGDEVD